MVTAPVRVIPIILILLAVYLAWTAVAQMERAGLICEAPVVVEVLNGCGTRGVADGVGGFLSDRSFDVMFVGNADDFGYCETVVVDRCGDRSKALEVATVLGRRPVVYQVSSSSFVDVTVIVGEDLAGVDLPAEFGR
jgi:hypothetical protein